MTLVVTGAGGYIGSALGRHLDAAGIDWLGACRQDPGQHASGRYRVGDLRDTAYCRALCQGATTVVHLAGQAHTRASEAALASGVGAITDTLVAAAIAQGVDHFIHISSTRANYPAHSAYARHKRATEQRLLQRHERGEIRVTCLRPPLVYGPGMRGNLATLLRLLRRRHLPCFPGGSVPIGMISLADCCRAIMVACEQPALAGACWEIHDGRRYTLDSLVAQVRDYLELPRPVLKLPANCVKWMAGLAGLVAPLTGLAFGPATYRALYREPYEFSDAFARASGFRPTQDFAECLPVLMPVDESQRS